ncbi:methyl-accepting chemotaxis protein [Desulfoluna sp.]|uniref:methyl-accepting chemotaxis protein n=1 Tax=Desulfoluna sp. TaxID=2045199 RepID=UPI0026334424|nr:methyl-accepting chemotaxis protein [Desulfoluna sp.]
MIFDKNSLRFKMLVTLCSVTLIPFIATVFYITHKAGATAGEEAREKTVEIAYRYGGVMQDKLEQAMTDTRALARVMEGVAQHPAAIDRDMLDDSLKRLLQGDDSYLGIWAIFEPDMLDGRDNDYANRTWHDESGIYYPYWYMEDGKIAVSVNDDYTEADYYQLPKVSGRETILQPYAEEDTGNILMTSVAVPVKKNGAVIGVVGIDIALTELDRTISTIKPFDTGHAILISNTGMVIAHPDKESTGKNLSAAGASPEILSAIQSGKEYALGGNQTGFGHGAYMFFSPLRIGQTATPWSFAVSVPLSTMQKDVDHIRKIGCISGLISILLVVGAIILFSGKITKSINAALSGLKSIAEGEGDLTQRLAVESSDETGQFASWFNIFIEKLQGIIGQFATCSDALVPSADRLLSISAKLASNAKKTSTQSARALASADGMNTELTRGTELMQESSENITMVASAIEELASTVTEISKNADSAKEASGRAASRSHVASEKMSKLTKAAEEIGKITNVISGISDQTNLLALNATIEAARAGEAGKGFAVVANEIKELAGQTVAATLDIREKIEGVQGMAHEAAGNTEAITKIINSVNDTINGIAAAVQQQSSVAGEISSNIAQASDGIGDTSQKLHKSWDASSAITKNISEITLSSKEITGISADVEERAKGLHNLTDELMILVKNFKI